ncbi:MAG: 1-phosphofructokinase family hexose kinase, partial [Alphaproteobacteria bacterium]
MSSTPAILAVTMNPALDVTAWVDEWEPQVKIPSRKIRRDPGGGGVNVARMARRWLDRESVEALVALGGPTGDRLAGLLLEEDIVCRRFTIADETRESWQISLPDGGFYRIIHPGPCWQAEEVRRFQALLAARAEALRPAWIVLSGSLPAGVEAAAMTALIAAARRAGRATRIAVDTRGEALVAALEAGVDLVKPDRREMASLARRLGHGSGDMLTLARRMVAAGRARVFCYTLGAKGLVIVRGEEAWRWEPPPVEPVSLAGAGDFLLGTLLARLILGDDWHTASRLAMATAAATAATEGTSPP